MNRTTARQHQDQLVYAAIGQRIAEARNDRGWSQKKLAEESGRTPGVIHGAEHGLSLTVPQLLSIADALDVNLYDLVPIE